MRCAACDHPLSEKENNAKNKFTGFYEDLCIICRNFANPENKSIVKNYEHQYDYQGLTKVPIDRYDSF